MAKKRGCPPDILCCCVRIGKARTHSASVLQCLPWNCMGFAYCHKSVFKCQSWFHLHCNRFFAILHRPCLYDTRWRIRIYKFVSRPGTFTSINTATAQALFRLTFLRAQYDFSPSLSPLALAISLNFLPDTHPLVANLTRLLPPSRPSVCTQKRPACNLKNPNERAPPMPEAN